MRPGLICLAVVLASAACGGDDDEDLDADGGMIVDNECEYQFNDSFIVATAEILEEGEGADIDGDMMPDNHLGFLRDVANPTWEGSIADGTIVALMDMRIPDRPGEDARFAMYSGMDSDSPANPEDNFSGQEPFLLDLAQFDQSCLSSGMFPEATWDPETEMLHAMSVEWSVAFSITDDIVLRNAQATAFLTGGGAGMTVEVTALWALCSLSTYRIDPESTASMLDLLVITYMKQPDIDADQDGLEQINASEDGMSIVDCIDGDGTRIPSKFCPCDPRMRDGYSVAMRATGVPARIGGVVARGH